MKRKKKVLRLKKGIKTALLIGALEVILCAVMFAYCNRIEAIQNNPNGYTESGHAHSVQVNFNR
jgi:hypothetical protein